MVNLRKRAPSKVTKTIPAKRTSGRISAASPSKIQKYATEIDEDIEIDLESGSESSSSVSVSASDLELSNSETDEVGLIEEEEGSEDDKEIRRIIKKTEAETRNIHLTARQRTKLEGGLQTDEPENQSDSKAALTDEQALRKSEKSRRRKLQRDQKIEETKRATIERLLLKQKKNPPTPAVSQVDGSNDETLGQDNNKSRDPFARSVESGSLRFIETAEKSILNIPDDFTFEVAFKSFSDKSDHRPTDCICQVCSKNPSKYRHPSKGTLFCSSSCFKMIK